jgi:hypothetical protein
MGHIDEDMVPSQGKPTHSCRFAGRQTAQSHDPQGEAYRLLVVSVCNAWHQSMDFLFERINDYTELLMPDDLLSGNSILAYTREAMTPDACETLKSLAGCTSSTSPRRKTQSSRAEEEPENHP